MVHIYLLLYSIQLSNLELLSVMGLPQQRRWAQVAVCQMLPLQLVRMALQTGYWLALAAEQWTTFLQFEIEIVKLKSFGKISYRCNVPHRVYGTLP